MTTARDEDHDYDEPFFEPACKEDELLQQLKNLSIPIISKDHLKYVWSSKTLGQLGFSEYVRT